MRYNQIFFNQSIKQKSLCCESTEYCEYFPLCISVSVNPVLCGIQVHHCCRKNVLSGGPLRRLCPGHIKVIIRPCQGLAREDPDAEMSRGVIFIDNKVTGQER